MIKTFIAAALLALAALLCAAPANATATEQTGTHRRTNTGFLRRFHGIGSTMAATQS